jgi:tRNA dimethylallyltransferase
MTSVVKALAVCGPTASGKSALGISLAKALQGEVVNVDSVQVYRDVDIGSAKVSMLERDGVPHHLLDLVPPDCQMNAGEYRGIALPCLREIESRGKLPVLVGGSGMYLTVLLHGMADVPATPPEVRAAVAALSREEQYEELNRVDPPTAARLHVNDTQRVSRALEIYRITGKRPSVLFEEHKFASQDVAALMIVICRERAELYARIDERSRLMIEQGLLSETKNLLDTYGEIAVLETIGYKQARDVISGKRNESECASEISLHTRRFAKRQMTYLRNEPLKRGWTVRPGEDEAAEEIVGFTGGSKRAQGKVKGFRALSMSEGELVEAVRERLKAPLVKSEVWYVHPR